MALGSSIFIADTLSAQGSASLPTNAETVLGNWYTSNLNNCASTGFTFQVSDSGQVIPSMMGSDNSNSARFPIRNEEYDSVMVALRGWPLEFLGQARWQVMIDLFNNCNQLPAAESQVIESLLAPGVGSSFTFFDELAQMDIGMVSNHYRLLEEVSYFSGDDAGRVRLYNEMTQYMRNNLDQNPRYRNYLSSIFFELYQSYSQGIGTVQSERAAFLNLRDSTSYGNQAGYYLLGMRFLNGQGTDQDGTDAYENFRRAALVVDVGDEANAMFRMGEILYQARNEEEALKWGLLALNTCNTINARDLPLTCDSAQMISDRNVFYRDHMSDREEQRSENDAYECSLRDIEDCGPETVRVRLGRAIGAMNPFDWFGR